MFDTYPISTPVGLMQAVMANQQLVELAFISSIDALEDASTVDPATYPKLVADVAKDVQRYFDKPHKDWLVDLSKATKSPQYQLSGTPLYQTIWRVMQTIPSGETRTYGDIAAEVGTGPRVVGSACRTNPFALMIPCHRVVASNGLGGYYGKTAEGISIKQALLAWEQKH